MRIEFLAVRDFPPFAEGVMEFPAKPEGGALAEIQLITGENGTGKTRLLSLLAAALGNPVELQSRLGGDTKALGVVGGVTTKHPTAWFTHQEDALIFRNMPRPSPEKLLQLGSETPAAARGFLLQNDSGDPICAMAFRGSASVSDAKVVALKPVTIGERKNLLLFQHDPMEDTTLGQSMVNLKIVAAMDALQNQARNETRAMRICARLESVVSKVTGRTFDFWVSPYPDISLRVNWGNARNMYLKQCPDGLRSIIGWLVACVARLDALFPEHEDPLSLPLVLLLDEPEGHLHPAWQRKLLPAAQALFPNGQFFVATHSPFVISSVNEGWIHILRFDDSGAVRFEPPRPCGKGDSYMEVIEDVLGVKEWYDPESETLLKDFRELKESVLNGKWEREADLREMARDIAARSESLRDLVGGELRQFERMKNKAAVAA